MTVVHPLPSATVLVIRDSRKGIQVLMVERAKSIEFAGGALAFPGGKVTVGDKDPRLLRYLASKKGLHRSMLARQAAAVREVFEESGLLLLRDARTHGVVSEAKRADLGRKWRRAMSDNRTELISLLTAHHLRLDPQLLQPFAHWVTPPFVPKRFDTSFFLAKAPPGQIVEHDGWEAVHSVWFTPDEALEAERAGEFNMMFPTRLNLIRLGKAHSVADAMAQARKQPIITVMPEIFKEDGIMKGRIPKNAGYGEIAIFDRLP